MWGLPFNSGGKIMAARLDHAVIVTTAVTADQVILTVTLAAITTYKLVTLGAALTTYSATEANVGLARIQADLTGGGWLQKFEQRFQNTDLDNNSGMSILPLGSGIAFAIGDDIRAICTPAATTSTRWGASFWGET
jgi:hypothetical protein